MLTMASLRFLTITLLSFLLLSPLIKRVQENIEKPVIVIAQDNSLSILAGKDSSFYRTAYLKELNTLIRDLQAKYSVETWSFSSRVSDTLRSDYTGKQTDISSVFQQMESKFANRNVGALVLATDGIFNKGGNPYYSARNAGYPIYCIAMGDTLVSRDIILKKVTYNRTAFLGDKFPVEVMIEANKCAGESTVLQIRKGTDQVFERQISFSREKDLQKISLLLDAKEKGLQHYTVTVVPVRDEHSTGNNSTDIFVEVSDVREKVAILYKVPHPDISAMRQALEKAAHFAVKESPIDVFTEPAGNFDLIILYQVPSKISGTNLRDILSARTSILYILGTGSDLAEFNKLNTGIQVTSDKAAFSEALPALNENFTYFTLDPRLKDLLRDVPPVVCPFGAYQLSPVSEVLAYQKIGNVRSRFPMIVFFQTPERKIGVIACENIWKWRLTDYLENQDHETFDELMGKIAQYLSFQGEKSFFIVKCASSVPENEKIEFRAELYNESYELINTPEVKLTITDEDNRSYNYTFAPSDKTYYLDAGTLPSGLYKYKASTSLGNKQYLKSGEFAVLPVNLEAINTIADHNLLYRLAKEHSGKIVSPHELQSLSKELRDREDIKPVSYDQKRFTDLASSLTLLVILLVLASAEWFLRRRSGLY